MFNILNLHCRLASCSNQSLFNVKHFSTSPMRWKTHYDTLGVHKLASKDKIKLKYFELSKRYHPDLSSDPEAKEKFTKVTQAYAVLGNEKSRKAYDNQLVDEVVDIMRRKLREARERDQARKREREKSEVGKAHPTTRQTINIGQWAYVMQEKRMKGDYTWEHPRRYREARTRTSQPTASSTPTPPRSSSPSSPLHETSSDTRTPNHAPEKVEKSDVWAAIISSIVQSALLGVGVVWFVSDIITSFHADIRDALDRWKESVE